MDTTNLTLQILKLQNEFDIYKEETIENNDAFFLCSMSLIIFLMQCGFAFLEAGCVRSKNTTNIIFKNVFDSLFTIIGYWSLGWGFAYGPIKIHALGPFIGQGSFFLNGFHSYPKFFFQFVFAATATTIVNGAVAERCEVVCYIVYCCVISTFVYPILTHWGWADEGWMKKGLASIPSSTYLDFAGAGMVHVCGGVISLVGAYIIGPRIGRYENSNSDYVEIKGHSVSFAALGGFILMFGFLAFNGGSTGTISTSKVGNTVALAMTVTILCGACAAITYLIIHYISKRKFTLLYTINACLSGMVAACAGCDNSEPWTAIITGGGAALIYLFFSNLCIKKVNYVKNKLRIDDPLDAFAVHFGGGIWGLFSTCFLRKNGILLEAAHALGGAKNNLYQTFMQLFWQMICAMAIILWSTLWMVPIFLGLKRVGKLRVSAEVEVKGIDIYKHGEAAYPLHAYGHGWDDYESMSKSDFTNSEVYLSKPIAVGNFIVKPLENDTTRRRHYNPSMYENPKNIQILKLKVETP